MKKIYIVYTVLVMVSMFAFAADSGDIITRLENDAGRIARVLEKMTNREKAREHEEEFMQATRALDDTERLMLRMECPASVEEAKRQHEIIEKALKRSGLFEQTERMRENEFYGLKFYELLPDGLDILRSLDGDTEYWEEVADELSKMDAQTKQQYERKADEVKILQNCEDVLRVKRGDITEEKIKGIGQLTAKASDIIGKMGTYVVRRDEKCWERYLSARKQRALVDLIDQYLLLQETGFLGSVALEDTTKGLGKAIQKYMGTLVNNYEEWVEIRTMLIHRHGKGCIYR